jgi:hypothetical protein
LNCLRARRMGNDFEEDDLEDYYEKDEDDD